MKRNRLARGLFVLLFIVSACGGSSHVPSPPLAYSTPIPSAIIVGEAYRSLPGSFLGFSIELSDLCTVLDLDAADRQTYEQLYTDLGRGILRIGGNSADLSTWSSSGAYMCSNSQTVITPALVTSLFAFATRIHWRVIWTLPLLKYNPTNAAREAAGTARVGGTALLGFAIGNEPELYSKKSAPYSASWNPSTFLSRWETEYRAVKIAVPGISISGPDASSIDAFFSSFAQQAGTAHQVALLTGHYYTRPARDDHPASIEELLSTGTFDKFTSDIARWTQAAGSAGLPFALTEINSISDSGVPGVSDTAAATFWLASTLLYAAAMGVSFAAIHEAMSASYNVIEDDGQPSVLYRALELVHQVVGDAQLAGFSGQIAPALQVMATRLADDTIQVVLVNHDPQTVQSVSVTTPGGTAAQSMTILATPALDATSHVRLETQAWTDTAPVRVNPESLVILAFRPL